jgi:hypothetical protein
MRVAISQPAQRAQPAMATAVVDGLPETCRADPALDQVAAWASDAGSYRWECT